MGGHRLNNVQVEKGIYNVNKDFSCWLYHLCICPIFIHQSLQKLKLHAYIIALS